jgi:hypothetical protein
MKRCYQVEVFNIFVHYKYCTHRTEHHYPVEVVMGIVVSLL